MPPKVGPTVGAIPVIRLPKPIIRPIRWRGTYSMMILNINGNEIPVPSP